MLLVVLVWFFPPYVPGCWEDLKLIAIEKSSPRKNARSRVVFSPQHNGNQEGRGVVVSVD